MQPFSLKPNTKKIFCINAVKLSLGLVLLVGGLLAFNSFIGLDVFSSVFDMVGVKLDPAAMIFYIIGAFLLGFTLLLGLNYVRLAGVRHDFTVDKIVSSSAMFFILLDKKEVPYNNIVRMSVDASNFFNSLFSTGDIVVELTAMKDNKITLNCIDHPEEVVQYIQKMIIEHKTQLYARGAQGIRIDNIFEKGGV